MNIAQTIRVIPSNKNAIFQALSSNIALHNIPIPYPNIIPNGFPICTRVTHIAFFAFFAY